MAAAVTPSRRHTQPPLHPAAAAMRAASSAVASRTAFATPARVRARAARVCRCRFEAVVTDGRKAITVLGAEGAQDVPPAPPLRVLSLRVQTVVSDDRAKSNHVVLASAIVHGARDAACAPAAELARLAARQSAVPCGGMRVSSSRPFLSRSFLSRPFTPLPSLPFPCMRTWTRARAARSCRAREPHHNAHAPTPPFAPPSRVPLDRPLRMQTVSGWTAPIRPRRSPRVRARRRTAAVASRPSPCCASLMIRCALLLPGWGGRAGAAARRGLAGRAGPRGDGRGGASRLRATHANTGPCAFPRSLCPLSSPSPLLSLAARRTLPPPPPPFPNIFRTAIILSGAQIWPWDLKAKIAEQRSGASIELTPNERALLQYLIAKIHAADPDVRAIAACGRFAAAGHSRSRASRASVRCARAARDGGSAAWRESHGGCAARATAAWREPRRAAAQPPCTLPPPSPPSPNRLLSRAR